MPAFIIKGKEYGDPRKQAEEANRLEARYFERVRNAPGQPRVISNNMFQQSDGSIRKTGQFAAGQGSMAGAGHTWTGGDSLVGGSGTKGQTITSAPIFYDPRYATPDKFYFPRTEIQANAMWRHLYETDPAIAVSTDMYAEMPWSEFDLIGVEDKHIRQTFEDMFSDLNLSAHLEGLAREFMKLGKVVPHLIFSNEKGYFTRLGAWDPDYIRIIPVPFMGEEPLLDLKPDPQMRAFMKSQDGRAQLLKNKLPAFLRDRILTNTPIPLQNTNTTYLARRTSPYRIIGVSIYSRLFRIQMFEDFLVNASMAVAQRNAAPLRLFRLGDPDTGWLPDDDDISQFAELLAICETDPFAALIYHTGVNVEYVGVSDRLMSISREWDFIERVKLLALGIAKSFLVGETSFAAALAGLQTLMERLLALRVKFESGWIYPKIIKPIARMNQFYRRKQSELDHRIRVSKTDEDLIFPHLKWHKALEATQDTAILGVWDELNRRGIVSERTLAAGAGVSLDVERRNIKEEMEYKKEEEWPKAPEEREETLREVLSAGEKQADDPFRFHVPSDVLDSKIWNKEGYCFTVHFTEVEPLVAFLKFGKSGDSSWDNLFISSNGDTPWDIIDDELQVRGFNDSEIGTFRKILEAEGVQPLADGDEEIALRLDEVNKQLGELPEGRKGTNRKKLLTGY